MESPEGVVHLVAERPEDRTATLRRLNAAGTPVPLARADEVARPQIPRNRPLPRSRDFR